MELTLDYHELSNENNMKLIMNYYHKFIMGSDMVHTFKNTVLEDDVMNYSKIDESTVLITFKIKRLDIYNVSCIKDIVDTAYTTLITEEKKGLNVILDCDTIKYIDSSAVGALLNTWQQLNKLKKSLVFCNVTGVMKQTLKNLDLDKFFMIFDTLEESCKWLKDKS